MREALWGRMARMVLTDLRVPPEILVHLVPEETKVKSPQYADNDIQGRFQNLKKRGRWNIIFGLLPKSRFNPFGTGTYFSCQNQILTSEVDHRTERMYNGRRPITQVKTFMMISDDKTLALNNSYRNISAF